MAVEEQMESRKKKKQKKQLDVRNGDPVAETAIPESREKDVSPKKKNRKRTLPESGDNNVIADVSADTTKPLKRKKHKKSTADPGDDAALSAAPSDGAAVSTEGPADYRAVAPPTEQSKKQPKAKQGLRKPKDRELEKRTIFVGNIPLGVNRNKLHKLFAPYGKIESIRVRSAPRLDAKKPIRMSVIKHRFNEDRTSQNGYVRFKELDSAQKATAEANGMLFEDHHLRVTLALSDQRPDPRLAVFVGGLALNAEDDQLWRLFADCGDIVSVRIIRDADSSIGKGFGYVNFASEEAVPRALKLNGSQLDGHTIRVQRCHATAHKKVDVLTGRKLRKVGDHAEKPAKGSGKLAPVSKFSGEAVAESKSSLKKQKKKKKERWDDTKRQQRKLSQSLSKTIAPAPEFKPSAPLTISLAGGVTSQNKKIKFDFGDEDGALTTNKKKDAEKLKEIRAKKETKRKKKSKATEVKHRRAIAEPLSNLLPS